MTDTERAGSLEQAIAQAKSDPSLVRHLPEHLIEAVRFEILVNRLERIERAVYRGC